MMEKQRVSWESVFDALELIDNPEERVYGIPRGGMIAAGFLKHAARVHRPEDATLFLDDIIDSGATRDRFAKQFPNTPFVALIDKTGAQKDLGWVVFPWEHHEEGPEDAVVRMLEYIGEDPKREGLLDTPRRVVRAWDELFAGYKQNPTDILARRFLDFGQYDEMVVLRNIPFSSMCEHHILPFYGTATVGYIPNGAVVGISKIARLVRCFARRLQVQERMTAQIAESIQDAINPIGVGVVIKATHLCMTSRGVMVHDTDMVTTKLLGSFMEPAARAEFLSYEKTGR